MVNQELIENIKARFQQGERADQVKEALLVEGWSEGDIQAAFGQIRHEALLQIPLYAKLHNWMQSVDQQTAELPTKTLVKIFLGIALVFAGVVAFMYYTLDPLGIQTSQRDLQREEATIALREALEKYYTDKKSYPANLQALVPNYLASIPVDPKSKQPFRYKPVEGNAHYEFCIDFEMQATNCVISNPESEIPVVLPEEAAAQEEETPQPSEQLAINGQIFVDTDENGSKSSEEDPKEGVEIRVTDTEGKTVCNMFTDTSGIFSCLLQVRGKYFIDITIPEGFTALRGNKFEVTLPTTDPEQPNIETLFIGILEK